MKILSIKNIVSIALMTAIISILSQFAIVTPLSPVPITLATFAIYLTMIILGWTNGTISVLVYVMLGFAGAPVFTGFTGGAVKVMGPTGGYIIGYIFLAVVEGAFVEWARGSAMIFVGMLLGTIVLYIFGTFWLMRQSGSNLVAAFIAGVVPFVIGDIVKMIVALFAGVKIRKILIRNNLI